MTTTRRWGPFKQQWFSLCSAHTDSNPNSTCQLCRAGNWHSILALKIEIFLWSNYPEIPQWWHSRPNSRTMKFLRKHFPNIR